MYRTDFGWYRDADPLRPNELNALGRSFFRAGTRRIMVIAKNKSQQEFVKEITPRSVDFAQWYTDVILKTDLVDYAPVRGCMAIMPYG